MNLARTIMLLTARISPATMLIIITVTGAGTGYLYHTSIASKDDAARAKIQELEKKNKPVLSAIVVARRDIPEGKTILPEDLSMESMETQKIPQGAIMDQGMALGLQSKFAISAGQPIPGFALSMAKPKGFIAKIKDGFRAVTFAVDTTTGVGGFVSPDSHVDIFAQAGSGAEVKSCAILSDVQVVAAGTEYKRVPGESEARPVSCVTVAVMPKDATKLINAMAAGRIYLTLRNDGDHTPLQVSTVSELFPKSAMVAAEPSIPRVEFAPPPPPRLSTTTPAVSAQIPEAPIPHTVELWAGTRRDEFNVSP